jgi:hypothetical protein
MEKPRRNLNKTTKECPAPQSEAPMLLLTLFSTHLSFRWTLPLILGWILLPTDDILQPPVHGIHKVLQVHAHKVSIALVCSEYEIVSSTEIAGP